MFSPVAAASSSDDDSGSDSVFEEKSGGEYTPKPPARRKKTPGPKSKPVPSNIGAVDLTSHGDDAVSTQENVLDTEGGDDHFDSVLIPAKSRTKTGRARSPNSGSPGGPRMNLKLQLNKAATAPAVRKRKRTTSPRTPTTRGHKTSSSHSGLLVPSSKLY